jgi:hypothetical protein
MKSSVSVTQNASENAGSGKQNVLTTGTNAFALQLRQLLCVGLQTERGHKADPKDTKCTTSRAHERPPLVLVGLGAGPAAKPVRQALACGKRWVRNSAETLHKLCALASAQAPGFSLDAS